MSCIRNRFRRNMQMAPRLRQRGQDRKRVHMRKRYTAFVVLIIAAVLLLACGCLTVYSFGQLVGANRRAADSHEAVYHLQRAISALKDVRGGARAIMLTGDAHNGP